MPGIDFQVVPDGHGRFRVTGEIDISVSDDLVELVSPATQDGGGDVVLDLSEVRFIDSSGIRAVIQLAGQLDGPRMLVLASPQREVAKVLELVGIRRMPNLRIVDGEVPHT